QVASYPTTYRINTPGGIALDNMSAYDWIERKVPGGHTSPMGQLLDVAYNIEYGAETTDQSALNLVYLLGYSAKPGNFAIFGASNEKYHIVGGNQRLPETIAANLVEPVATGWRMTAIGFNRDGSIAVTFSAGGQAAVRNFDRVILALPFAVLRTLSYRKANFDSMKNTAIQELGRCRNDKLQLQFTSRYWNNQSGPWVSEVGISNGASKPTLATRTPGTSPGASQERPGSWSITPVETWPDHLPLPPHTAAPRPTRRSRPTPRPSSTRSSRFILASVGPGTAGPPCRFPHSTQTSIARTRTGRSVSTTALAATKKRASLSRMGPSISLVSIARRTSRASWRAVRRKALGRPTRFCTITRRA